MFKANKNHKKIFTAVKLILFIGVIYLVYQQVSSLDQEIWKELSFDNPISLVLCVLLVIPNIWLAYLKWWVTLDTAQINSNQRNRIHSFFAGIVTGMLTPNMVGNFLGRLYYFDKSHRATITGLTLLSNYAQFLTSLTFGLVGVMITNQFYLVEDIELLTQVLFVGLLVSYILYFYFEKIIGGAFKRLRSTDLIKVVKRTNTYRLKILALSYARFLIFTSQFLLMLNAFGVVFSWDLILAIWQVYLVTMIAPSLFLGKVGIKEAISIYVLSALGINEFAILFTSLLIWFINSLSPALIGLLICRKKEIA